MKSGKIQLEARLARQLHIFGGLVRDQRQICHISGGKALEEVFGTMWQLIETLH